MICIGIMLDLYNCNAFNICIIIDSSVFRPVNIPMKASCVSIAVHLMSGNQNKGPQYSLTVMGPNPGGIRLLVQGRTLLQEKTTTAMQAPEDLNIQHYICLNKY